MLCGHLLGHCVPWLLGATHFLVFPKESCTESRVHVPHVGYVLLLKTLGIHSPLYGFRPQRGASGLKVKLHDVQDGCRCRPQLQVTLRVNYMHIDSKSTFVSNQLESSGGKGPSQPHHLYFQPRRPVLTVIPLLSSVSLQLTVTPLLSSVSLITTHCPTGKRTLSKANECYTIRACT